MKFYRELDIHRFEPWGGAIEICNKIIDADRVLELENLLEDLYPDGIEETQLNDLLWFDSEWVLEQLGINDDESEEE